MDDNHVNNEARSQVSDPSGACQAWILRPLDKGPPFGLLVACIVVILVIFWMLPPGYYPIYGVVLLASPMIIVLVVIHEMLFAKKEVRVGRDGVYQPRWLGKSFVAWTNIREVDVMREVLDVALRDGSRLKLRFARPLGPMEQAELGRCIPILRAGPLQSHPLALQDGEAPDAWLARIKTASLAVEDYRHAAADEQTEMFTCARNRDLSWTARLAALVRLHLAGVSGLRALQGRISDEYAAPPVMTAFRVADLGDRALLSCCNSAVKCGAMVSSQDARS